MISQSESDEFFPIPFWIRLVLTLSQRELVEPLLPRQDCCCVPITQLCLLHSKGWFFYSLQCEPFPVSTCAQYPLHR